MNRRQAGVLVGLLLCLLIVGGTSAQGSAAIDWWVAGSGGSPSTGNGGVALNDTIGQPIVGPFSNEPVSLGAGYWYGPETQYRVYLPLTLRNGPQRRSDHSPA